MPFLKQENLVLERVITSQREVEIYLYYFFNLGARWGGWSTPRPGRYNPPPPQRNRPNTRHAGGRVGPKAGLVKFRKFSRTLVFDPRTRQPKASIYTA
jgi:hypothetical protein